MSSMSNPANLLTCITCRVGFHDPDLQRDHYKSDWHRYNLKRKIVALEPVTAEDFQLRVELQEAKNATSNSKDNSKYCTTCQKEYKSAKAFKNHLLSKKHLGLGGEGTTGAGTTEEESKDEFNTEENGSSVRKGGKKFPPPYQPLEPELIKAKANEMDVDEDEDGSDWEEVEGSPLPTNECLFCEKVVEDTEERIQHMSTEHSFFIPDLDYCIDIEGLLGYLGEKIGEGMVCLWCNEKGKQFYDVNSVRQHMRDKGHCKILHTEETMFEFTDYYDYSSSYPDGVEVHPDEAYQPETLQFNDNMQLVLPSGVTLGHRSLKIYYKQYLRPGAQLMLHKKAKQNNILSHYKAIGYGITSVAEAQKKFRDQKIIKQARDKYFMKLGVTGNKTTQTYFRRQVQF